MSQDKTQDGEDETRSTTEAAAAAAATTTIVDSSSSSDLATWLSEKATTIFVLDAPLDGKVYLVGTAHFSVESQREVAELIRRVQPNRVVLELCGSRVNILKLDEATILREAKEMNLNKMIQLIKQSSVVHGLLQILMVRLYSKVTEELGLAPGGEFRVAYNEANKVPGCKVILGDMPIGLTLSRGFGSLPWYRKLRLAWTFLTMNHDITDQDIEELKKSDILDTLVKEFGATFPEFKRVLIDERDIYLTHSLHKAYQPIPNEFVPGGHSPACVVGVVGLGHVNGIKKNWNEKLSIQHLTKKQAKRSARSGYLAYAKLAALIGTATLVYLRFIRKN